MATDIGKVPGKRIRDISEVVAPDINYRAETPEKVAGIIRDLELMATERHDLIVPGHAMSFNGTEAPGDLRLLVDSGGMAGTVEYPRITKTAHSQIAEKYGIPTAYYNRMLIETPELLARNLNHWNFTDPDKNHLIRALGNKVRADLSDTYKVMDSLPFFLRAHDGFKKWNAKIVRVDLTEDRFYVRALVDDWAIRLERQQDAAKSGGGLFQGYTDTQGHASHNPGTANIVPMNLGNVGTDRGQAARSEHMMIPGMVLSNSETGQGGIRGEGFILDTYCSNGAIIGESIFRVHLGQKHAPGVLSVRTMELEAETVFSTIGDVIDATFDQAKFRAIVDRMSAATGEILEAPIEAVENIVTTYKYSDADKQRIINELISGGDPSVFGLMSAITATARDKKDYNDGIQMERDAVDMLGRARELVKVR